MKRKRILGVGIATLDIINHVETTPNEDDEVRALAQEKRRGGNATNTLVVLSRLGWDADWAGVLPDESDTAFVLSDLERNHVSLDYVHRLGQGKLPTSYITLSKTTGARTIVHYRDLPEFQAAWFASIDLDRFDWIHFEGRALDQLRPMLEMAAASPARVSLEVEKPRPGIEQVFGLPDLLLFSRGYANAQGYGTAEMFLAALSGTRPAAVATCAWGDHGAWAYSDDTGLLHAPAYQLIKVVDSIAAGDTFNAAMIDSIAKQQSLDDSLRRACYIAALKCSNQGFEAINDTTLSVPARRDQ